MGAFLVWTSKTGESKSLFFDAVTEESQMLSMSSTDSPVEDGPDITDHVRQEVDRVSLQVFVSNQPIIDKNGRGGRVSKLELNPPKYKPPLQATPGSLYAAAGGAIKSAVGSLVGGGSKQTAAQVLQFPNEFDAVADTIQIFQKLRDTKQLVDVVTRGKYYEGMLAEKVSVSRDASTGDGAKISIDFKQILTVQVSIVAAPVPTEIRGEAMKPKGVQAAKPAKAPEKKKAILKGMIDQLKK
jgi:hypothetical protein